MGCGASAKRKDAGVAPQAPQAPQPPPAQSGGGKKPKFNKAGKFQWKSSAGWNNYDPPTDAKLKQAYLVGRERARFDVKTPTGVETYDFEFGKGRMKQTNAKTGKPREMRPPMGMSPPKEPVLPEGEFIVITLTQEHLGKSEIQVNNPHKPGEKITVSLPKKAKKGQKIAVPIPAVGQSVEDVAKKQQGMTTGAKVAMGAGVTALAGAAVVGGVILGDHLAGGSVAVDGADAVADFAVDAGDAMADWAPDALDSVGDFAEDVGEWLGDAGEDIGEWICSVF